MVVLTGYYINKNIIDYNIGYQSRSSKCLSIKRVYNKLRICLLNFLQLAVSKIIIGKDIILKTS